jgi:hypothetical protein
LLSPISLSQKAESVADSGDTHKKDTAAETRSDGIDPGFLKGMGRHCWHWKTASLLQDGSMFLTENKIW